MSDKQMVPCSL